MKVCFTYDINSILEVERRLRELEVYKMMPPGGIRASLVLAGGDRLFAELLGNGARLWRSWYSALRKP